MSKKQCKQCGQGFEITDEDLKFYDQVSPVINGVKYEIPVPTMCPDCRKQRRLAYRNESSLYHRKCDETGKQIISIYSADKPYKVYDHDVWWGDKQYLWDPMDYGREFDFERSFFEQLNELKLEVPRINNGSMNNENCDFTNFTADSKNCYLVIATENSEDCYYCKLCQGNKDCVDCDYIWDSELCYGSVNLTKCNRCMGCVKLENCSDCSFCFNLKGCKDCLFSYNLSGQQYRIFNKQYSKEEYEKEKAKYDFGSGEAWDKAMVEFKRIVRDEAIHRAGSLINCENCTGDNLKNCKNMKRCFDLQDSEGCVDCAEGDAKFCYDCNSIYYSPELCLEIVSMLQLYSCAFTSFGYYSSYLYYCDYCHHSEHLFGCIGLRRKKYCILNKQYTKEEYEELVPRIIEHMRKTGEWGEFPPVEHSPFAYNETIASEYFPLSRETVLAQGWKWKDDDSEKMYKGPEVKVLDNISDVDDGICRQILRCEKSGKLFKIIPQELKFHKKMGIALPKRAPHQRHLDRMEFRNPGHLWERECDKCGKRVETNYAPGRPEKIYCEKCYLAEVF